MKHDHTLEDKKFADPINYLQRVGGLSYYRISLRISVLTLTSSKVIRGSTIKLVTPDCVF